jgi:hypothetical protein
LSLATEELAVVLDLDTTIIASMVSFLELNDIKIVSDAGRMTFAVCCLLFSDESSPTRVDPCEDGWYISP